MALEKISDPRKLGHWPGHMETDYIYTLGLAGEKFFKQIRDNGRILGAKCKRCDIVVVPPRLYCERCFKKLTEWVDLGTKGTVHTFTVAYIDVAGARMREPVIFALIEFDGASGGLLHKLGDVKPHEVRIGMPVEAVLKQPTERTASINDIRYFKPLR